MDKEKKELSKKIKIRTLTSSIAIFIFFLILFFAMVVYRLSDRVSFSDKISQAVPFPAVLINGKNFITTKEIAENLKSIKRFYENQDFSSLGYKIDFNTEDGKKRLKIREIELINKMIEDKAIEVLARERGIFISDKLVDDSVDRKTKEYGSSEYAKENLKKLYGWSLSDFKDKVVEPSLYKEELKKWLNENENKEKNQKAKNLADNAKGDLNSGKSFEEVAKANSTGYTADKGGRLGWFKKEYVSPDISDAVFSLGKGETSDVLESELGYHIVRMNDNKMGDDGEILYDLSQIYFPKVSFADWITERIKEMKVVILISGYEWNKDTGMVEFQDRDMREFEKKALENKAKDPSLLSI